MRNRSQLSLFVVQVFVASLMVALAGRLFYDVMFTTPVKKDFVEQYEHIADFFYNVQARGKSSIVKPKEELSDTAQKVVSILEALQSKKDKPVH